MLRTNVLQGEVQRSWVWISPVGAKHVIDLWHDTVTGVRSVAVGLEEVPGSMGSSPFFTTEPHHINFTVGHEHARGMVIIEKAGLFSFRYTCVVNGRPLRATLQGLADENEERFYVSVLATANAYSTKEKAVTWYELTVTRRSDDARTVVHRRYREFQCLFEQVHAAFKGHHLRSSLPELPGRQLKLLVDHTDTAFVEERRLLLETAVGKLLSVPHVCAMVPVQVFLGFLDRLKEHSVVFTQRDLGMSITRTVVPEESIVVTRVKEVGQGGQQTRVMRPVPPPSSSSSSSLLENGEIDRISSKRQEEDPNRLQNILEAALVEEERRGTEGGGEGDVSSSPLMDHKDPLMDLSASGGSSSRSRSSRVTTAGSVAEAAGAGAGEAGAEGAAEGGEAVLIPVLVEAIPPPTAAAPTSVSVVKNVKEEEMVPPLPVLAPTVVLEKEEEKDKEKEEKEKEKEKGNKDVVTLSSVTLKEKEPAPVEIPPKKEEEEAAVVATPVPVVVLSPTPMSSDPPLSILQASAAPAPTIRSLSPPLSSIFPPSLPAPGLTPATVTEAANKEGGEEET
eukprot:evm.model.NODE_6992_length_9071_cov_23.070004.4